MIDVLRPWRRPGRLLGDAGYALTAMPIGAVGFAAIVALGSVTTGLLVTFVLALPFIWALFVVSRGLGRLQR
ncbi:MAG: hypothetical protein ACRDZ2_00390, partial [Ilumatobacteraceae bacterium]